MNRHRYQVSEASLHLRYTHSDTPSLCERTSYTPTPILPYVVKSSPHPSMLASPQHLTAAIHTCVRPCVSSSTALVDVNPDEKGLSPLAVSTVTGDQSLAHTLPVYYLAVATRYYLTEKQVVVCWRGDRTRQPMTRLRHAVSAQHATWGNVHVSMVMYSATWGECTCIHGDV